MVDETDKDKLPEGVLIPLEKMASNLDSILTEPQKQLVPHLEQLNEFGFVMGGGIGVSAYAGHRESSDFDMFTTNTFDPPELQSKLNFGDLEISNTREAPNTLEYFFNVPLNGVDTLVKLSLFGKPNMTFTAEVVRDIHGYTFCVMHPRDLFAAKLAALTGREEWKDYVDIAILIQQGYSLSQAAVDVEKLFGTQIDKEFLIRSLNYAEKMKGLNPNAVTVINNELKRLGWRLI